jgi:hypothetical protein
MRTKPPLGHNSGGFSFGSVGTFGAGRTRVLGLWRASPNAPQRRRQAARASGVSFGLPPRGRQAVVSLFLLTHIKAPSEARSSLTPWSGTIGCSCA